MNLSINNQVESEFQLIKAALGGTKITHSLPYEIDSCVSTSVEKAIFFLGLKTAIDDRNAIKITVISDIKKHFSNLTLSEISIAIDNGVRGKYGGVIGLSPKDVYNWIDAYSKSAERNMAKGEIITQKVKNEPTADEKFTVGKDLCLELFAKYEASQQLTMSALAVYEYLKSLDLIQKDYKIGIYKQAVEETIKNKRIEVTLSQDLHRRRIMNAELEILEQNYLNDGLTQDQHNEVLRTGRKIILKNWFDDLIINEENLEELIEAKRT